MVAIVVFFIILGLAWLHMFFQIPTQYLTHKEAWKNRSSKSRRRAKLFEEVRKVAVRILVVVLAGTTVSDNFTLQQYSSSIFFMLALTLMLHWLAGGWEFVGKAQEKAAGDISQVEYANASFAAMCILILYFACCAYIGLLGITFR